MAYPLQGYGKTLHDQEVMRDNKCIPCDYHAEHEDPGAGYDPVADRCNECNENDDDPFECHVEQGERDDGDHHRVHLVTPVGKDQRCREYIEKTEREQPEGGDPDWRVHIGIQDLGTCR